MNVNPAQSAPFLLIYPIFSPVCLSMMNRGIRCKYVLEPLTMLFFKKKNKTKHDCVDLNLKGVILHCRTARQRPG